jgi:hypothetical protein
MFVTDIRPFNIYPLSLGVQRRNIVPHSYSRRTFLETTFIAGAALATQPQLSHAYGASNSDSTPPKPSFPVADYHVHLSNTLSIDQALQLGKDRGVQIGIVEHPGTGFPLNTDADLKKYIDGLRKYCANTLCASVCSRCMPDGQRVSRSPSSTNSTTS